MMYALIMAGGRGARFWPRSRRAFPKQCVAIGGPDSLIRQTVDRLAPMISPEHILVITGPDMVDAIAAQLPDLPAENILVEPQGRNTAPCVGWGAVEVARRGGEDAVMMVLPADHVITAPEILRDSLAGAAAAAVETGALVTLGITPTHPETGYGYLELGDEAGQWAGQSLRVVSRFQEKPDATTAAQYVASGRHLWNAGMFVFTAGAVLSAFAAHLPRSAVALRRIAADPGSLAEAWGELEATSIDFGIMERVDNILTAPCDPGWSDVGSWSAAGALLPEDAGGRGETLRTLSIDAADNITYAPGKVVALIGVSGLAVVDADDALLVMDASRAQEVRDIVTMLETTGLPHLT
ncbi:MAG: sugar phosphate nucleotidyltransferase [Myxococcota bacterium]|nr:sugar phosphate nucleotidyltransferase [Myxococcota bacterium]